MRVVHYLDTDQFAGTERHVIDLATASALIGIDVAIACPPDSPLGSHAVAAGIEVIPILRRSTVDPKGVASLCELLRSRKTDVLHAHNGRTSLAGAAAVAWTQTGRCVVTQHFLSPHHVARRGVTRVVYDAAHRWVNRRVHHFIAISEAVKAQMLARGDCTADRVSVIYNGIRDLRIGNLADVEKVRRDLGIEPDAPLVVCAARLEKEKDVASLIDAMSIVCRSNASARCVIAGEGAEFDRLNAQITRADLQSRVRLLGFRNDVHAVIQAGDLFALPSVAEPFGLVVAEAMSLGRPVVSTNVGGPAEIVVDGETGLLVGPGEPEALAAAILKMLDYPELRNGMGAAGRARYESHFTAARMAQHTREIYVACLASHGHDSPTGRSKPPGPANLGGSAIHTSAFNSVQSRKAVS